MNRHGALSATRRHDPPQRLVPLVGLRNMRVASDAVPSRVSVAPARHEFVARQPFNHAILVDNVSEAIGGIWDG